MTVQQLADNDRTAENGSRPFSLRPCDRCGELHVRLMFRKFSRRDIGRWNYWALCPTNGEPVMMVVKPEEAPA